MRSHHRAQAVVRVGHVRHPVPQRLIHGVFERAASRSHGADLGAEQLHAKHVELLARRVHLTHVDDALDAEQRRRGGGRHAVLPGARSRR